MWRVEPELEANRPLIAGDDNAARAIPVFGHFVRALLAARLLENERSATHDFAFVKHEHAVRFDVHHHLGFFLNHLGNGGSRWRRGARFRRRCRFGSVGDRRRCRLLRSGRYAWRSARRGCSSNARWRTRTEPDCEARNHDDDRRRAEDQVALIDQRPTALQRG